MGLLVPHLPSLRLLAHDKEGCEQGKLEASRELPVADGEIG